MSKWFTGLTLRNMKAITTKGCLFSKLFRNFKNLTKTRLLVKDMAETAGLTEQRYKVFENGQFEEIPQDIMDKLVLQIQMTWPEFKEFAKKSAIPGMGIFAQDVVNSITKPNTEQPQPPAATTTPVLTAQTHPPATTSTSPAQATKQPAAPTNKPAPAFKPSGLIQVENYFEEAMVIIYDRLTNTIKLLPNLPNKNYKGGKLLPNAIDFGKDTVPGKAVI